MTSPRLWSLAQDTHIFRGHCNTLMSRTAELEARLGAAEAQCTDLLDFIEVRCLHGLARAWI